VTVGTVLDNRERWHGERFADPLEPDYRGDKRIAWLNLRSGGGLISTATRTGAEITP